MKLLIVVLALMALSACDERDTPFPDLPVHITEPGSAQAKGVVIFWSGDAGWSGSMQGIADALAKRGYGVVGLSSLSYFWYEQAPETMATDTERLVGHYSDSWKSDTVILLGYSFGADTLPFAWPHLSEATKEKTRLIGLLSPFKKTEFEVTIQGMLGIIRGDHDVVAAIDKLPAAQTFCLTGKQETDMACNTDDGYETVFVAGGHGYDQDWNRIAALLDTAVDARSDF
ncbi:MAG: AcvB/VirJ family lysyl-phosphatidylglycerol hydrolase [Stappiaceae bacterium]